MPANQLTTAEVRQHFPQFSEPALQQAIAEEGRIHHFAEGEMMMDYDGYIRMLPLILSGTIKISRLANDGSELFLYYLTRGDSCTMTFSCCMSEKRSEIRAVAEEPTSMLGLPPRKLDEWMMHYTSWKNFVLQSYDRRMSELITTIDQVTFHQLDDRLLDYLGRRASITDDRTIRTTHQEIADDLNVSREAVSRLLKGLERKGTIKLGRNSVRIAAE
ncbi:CRP/FNR family transcriptional regulator [Lewinella aquimaris]|uniref:CRP/FNR family transcriptional regulator n=1 Tax=Neolewinella aquimaris TaxID=1835722 RepID=A0A840E4M5_9BACT|nr:Crp/Fnr family transcriptional regulator [Neolewinella aquimaris]MBB4080131.1 CRP/FNR family transcriptional regulator [Neolewinella aquimaris]